MPSIFKVLATITVWILFIWGCVTILFTEIGYWVNIGIGNSPDLTTFMGWGLGTAELTLSVVCMKLRQMLE